MVLKIDQDFCRDFKTFHQGNRLARTCMVVGEPGLVLSL